jgi:hypothetical protein
MSGFPQLIHATDIGSIDLLCEDRNGKLVVVETKKGRESDKVVGQILRYMGWVSKQMEKKVRGVIVVSEPDERLEYALHGTRDIALKFYKVRFELADLVKSKSVNWNTEPCLTRTQWLRRHKMELDELTVPRDDELLEGSPSRFVGLFRILFRRGKR